MGSGVMVSRQGRGVLNCESRALSTEKLTPSLQEEGREEELKLGTCRKQQPSRFQERKEATGYRT